MYFAPREALAKREVKMQVPERLIAAKVADLQKVYRQLVDGDGQVGVVIQLAFGFGKAENTIFRRLQSVVLTNFVNAILKEGKNRQPVRKA